jgi:hypothetical protein
LKFRVDGALSRHSPGLINAGRLQPEQALVTSLVVVPIKAGENSAEQGCKAYFVAACDFVKLFRIQFAGALTGKDSVILFLGHGSSPYWFSYNT